MATFKRGKTWWTDFTQDGVRYRESLRTTNWQEALRNEKQRIIETSNGHSVASHRKFAKWSFDKAAGHYLETRKLHLAPRSLEKERELLSDPKRYFGKLPLVRLTPEMLRQYLVSRKEEGLSNVTLNMVSGGIRRLLKMAKRWHLFVDDLKRLPEEVHVGRALTGAELSRLLDLAQTRSDWVTLRCAITLAVTTTMRSVEMKNLRWRDIDLFEKVITVRRSKTAAGLRVIPLNDDAFGAIMTLLKAAQLFAGSEPEHFVFPSCESGRIDPRSPVKSWRTAWRTLTRAIQCPGCARWQAPGTICSNQICRCDISGLKSGTCGLRFHDLRHTAITILAESNASEQTVMAIAGHVSRQMMEYYSHIRMDAKRNAVSALLTRVAPKQVPITIGIGQRYDTNHDTNAQLENEDES